MRRYVERLGVTMAHAYYEQAPIPLRMVPADPVAFDRQGHLLRRRGNEFLVIGDSAAPMPRRLDFDIVATDPEIFSVTRHAEWGKVLKLTVPPGTDDLAFGPATEAGEKMRSRMERIAQVGIDMQGDAPRAVTLRFDSIEALWAYHVTGPGIRDDLIVVDPANDVSFSPRGSARLPDGSNAQVIRSDVPLPARARPGHRFMLQRPGAFGPETLVPVLPAAGKLFKPIPEEDGAAARLQSDIYVTLW